MGMAAFVKMGITISIINVWNATMINIFKLTVITPGHAITAYLSFALNAQPKILDAPDAKMAIF